MNRLNGFTLAEVLITLGVIGVVSAIVLPTVFNNIQEHVRKAQIRTVKYKFTKATDKMNSLGLMTTFSSTNEFVNELQKHLKLAKICQAENIAECWPYREINMSDGTKYDITNITDGVSFKKHQGDWSSPVVGIVTADGTPMIFSYKKNCQEFNSTMQYTWTSEDGKPVTNATTSCIAGIFEINGKAGKNKPKKDVISFGANGIGTDCFNIKIGSECFGEPFIPAPSEDCGIYSGGKVCNNANSYWKGGVVACEGVGNMATFDELIQMANSFVIDHKFNSKIAQENGFFLEPAFSIMSGTIPNTNQDRRRTLEISTYNSKYPERTVGEDWKPAAGSYVMCR